MASTVSGDNCAALLRGALVQRIRPARTGRRRTMATRRVATVFGGSGFIGRYVVKRLAQQGYIVRVPSRDPEGALFLKPMGAVGQVVPLYASVSNEPTVHRAVEGAEIVANLVGLLAESGTASF